MKDVLSRKKLLLTEQKIDPANIFCLDPIYPVQVITGSAGCREFRGFFRYPKPDWSVFRTNEYGFTRLNVKDRLTIELEQYSIEQAKVVDKFTVSKSGNYPNFGVGKPDRF